MAAAERRDDVKRSEPVEPAYAGPVYDDDLPF
jgi:hypothetical protein